ncbi:hypothetical protein FIBSPDRAFT_884486 [Athelia psychrophila]|uniref:Uncharacterized protein n=1 Tax=Athelia psychrophila TaxID=1759441 RepID=A0A166T6E3_9AGAM|nr:hypothetical protein FIBSPDRAFT_884486 [Fibularhizoctonia sp. CBS 109695]
MQNTMGYVHVLQGGGKGVGAGAAGDRCRSGRLLGMSRELVGVDMGGELVWEREARVGGTGVGVGGWAGASERWHGCRVVGACVWVRACGLGMGRELAGRVLGAWMWVDGRGAGACGMWVCGGAGAGLDLGEELLHTCGRHGWCGCVGVDVGEEHAHMVVRRGDMWVWVWGSWWGNGKLARERVWASTNVGYAGADAGWWANN